jgi:hypothetical protein
MFCGSWRSPDSVSAACGRRRRGRRRRVRFARPCAAHAPALFLSLRRCSSSARTRLRRAAGSHTPAVGRSKRACARRDAWASRASCPGCPPSRSQNTNSSALRRRTAAAPCVKLRGTRTQHAASQRPHSVPCAAAVGSAARPRLRRTAAATSRELSAQTRGHCLRATCC